MVRRFFGLCTAAVVSVSASLDDKSVLLQRDIVEHRDIVKDVVGEVESSEAGTGVNQELVQIIQNLGKLVLNMTSNVSAEADLSRRPFPLRQLVNWAATAAAETPQEVAAALQKVRQWDWAMSPQMLKGVERLFDPNAEPVPEKPVKMKPVHFKPVKMPHVHRDHEEIAQERAEQRALHRAEALEHAEERRQMSKTERERAAQSRIEHRAEQLNDAMKRRQSRTTPPPAQTPEERKREQTTREAILDDVHLLTKKVMHIPGIFIDPFVSDFMPMIMTYRRHTDARTRLFMDRMLEINITDWNKTNTVDKLSQMVQVFRETDFMNASTLFDFLGITDNNLTAVAQSLKSNLTVVAANVSAVAEVVAANMTAMAQKVVANVSVVVQGLIDSINQTITKTFGGMNTTVQDFSDISRWLDKVVTLPGFESPELQPLASMLANTSVIFRARTSRRANASQLAADLKMNSDLTTLLTSDVLFAAKDIADIFHIVKYNVQSNETNKTTVQKKLRKVEKQDLVNAIESAFTVMAEMGQFTSFDLKGKREFQVIANFITDMAKMYDGTPHQQVKRVSELVDDLGGKYMEQVALAVNWVLKFVCNLEGAYHTMDVCRDFPDLVIKIKKSNSNEPTALNTQPKEGTNLKSQSKI